MKNFKLNKQKVISLVLAMGMCLCPKNCCSDMTNSNEYIQIRVTGNKVNVRLTPTTDTKKNIIGRVNAGDTFTMISHENGWYLVDYYGDYAYISDQYSIEITSQYIVSETDAEEINMAKITGNNINVRSSNSTESKAIGFADITDFFEIIDKVDDWYVVNYLGKKGYIYSKYVDERLVPSEDLKIEKMVYLTCESGFYGDTNGTYLSTLPINQYAAVIKEENGYYKVRIDGVIGYIKTSDTKKLTDTFIVSDLGRQIVKVFKDNKEVYRAHLISGRKSMQSDLGKFKIGHKIKGYQLTKTNYVDHWMQYHNNEGYHDAPWQKDSYFVEVARDAYERFSKGITRTYPISHGSHGCGNLGSEDAEAIFYIIHVNDDVLIIVTNNFVNDNLISKDAKVKILV